METKQDNVVFHIDPQTRYDNEYTSCCSKSKTDARLLQYVSRFTLSILTLGFAGVQLIRAGPCDSLTPFYSSLITFILGSWLKTTSHNINLPT